MNWKNTWTLAALAGGLFAFIYFIERRIPPVGAIEPVQPLFAQFRPTAATSFQLRRGVEVNFALEQTNDGWRFTKPFAYPAANFAVHTFLEMLERVVPATHISPREILSRKQTVADFGFAEPPIVITLQRGDELPKQLRFGARTPAGDQVYVEVDGQPGLSVINADLLDKIPRSPHDWRTTALFHLGEEKPDRVEISHGATFYALQLDATNKLWRLDRPRHRADQFQVRQLLDKIQLALVTEFVADPPQADDEAFGLQAPEFEIKLASGAQERKVQFGRSPTNNPGLVYARLLSHSNVVLVSRGILDALAAPPAQLRERLIVPFAPELVDVIEVEAEVNFSVRKEAGGWKAGEVPADPAFVSWWLALLAQVEATNFVRDIVTDFTPYGLAPGQRQYRLFTAVTNGASVTNIRVAEIAFGIGTNGSGEIFARRKDEDSVYAVRQLDFSHMPGAAWQFREHRIWNFATNQVQLLAVRQGENVREVFRQPDNKWLATKGWTAEINPFAMEETARGLGELSAIMWMARGESARAQYGFPPGSPRVTVQLQGEKAPSLVVEFGSRRSPWRLPYALVTIDGQPTVFEFPWPLYADLQRYFGLEVPERESGF
ncbi:MAG TPA: DUF4340 domain-containing protein [Verrucomicrobiae bacterium]